MKQATCLVCGFGNSRFYLNKNGYNLYQCLECGLIFVWPLPEKIDSIYDKDYFQGSARKIGYVDYDKDKQVMRNTFLKYIELISNYSLIKKGKVLDIGAATGFFVNLAIQAGWQAEGLEISSWAAEVGQKRGLPIHLGVLETVFWPKEYFDVLTLFDVFEHFIDPRSALNKMHFILKKGGLVMINTIDASSFWARFWGKKWHALLPPEHLYFYNKKNIQSFLEKNGFKVLAIKKIRKNFTLGYIFYILSFWLQVPILERLSSFFSKKWINKIFIPLNLRDNMLIIARKE